MSGNGGYAFASEILRRLPESPAPRRNERSPRAQVFNRDPKAKERIAELVAKLKSKIVEPSKH